MSAFLYVFYFFRSLYYRGISNTVRILLNEKRYEKFFNIHTLQIKPSEDKDNFHYQGASYYVLLDLFKHVPEKAMNKIFIDYGCGKGRALFCAEYLGFNFLTGVELDNALIDEAKENLKNYSKKRPESQFEFVNQNAIDFAIPENSLVFYFFNPFSDAVMEKVIANILDYRKKIDETIYVVYVNPKYRKLWVDAGFSDYYTQGNKRYTEAIIFSL